MKRILQKTCVWIAWKSGWLNEVDPKIVRAYMKERNP
jgi:hypothetical protein